MGEVGVTVVEVGGIGASPRRAEAEFEARRRQFECECRRLGEHCQAPMPAPQTLGQQAEERMYSEIASNEQML